MIEDVDHLKAANPETYQKLDNMFITAAAGRDYTEQFAGRLGIGKVKTYQTHDGAVSVKSRHGESLGALIDDRPSYDIK